MVASPDKISQFYHNGGYSKWQDDTSVDRCGGQVTLSMANRSKSPSRPKTNVKPTTNLKTHKTHIFLHSQ